MWRERRRKRAYPYMWVIELFFYLFIYLGKAAHAMGGEGQRKTARENPKQAPWPVQSPSLSLISGSRNHDLS